jgi:hypothetical protein
MEFNIRILLLVLNVCIPVMAKVFIQREACGYVSSGTSFENGGSSGETNTHVVCNTDKTKTSRGEWLNEESVNVTLPIKICKDTRIGEIEEDVEYEAKEACRRNSTTAGWVDWIVYGPGRGEYNRRLIEPCGSAVGVVCSKKNRVASCIMGQGGPASVVFCGKELEDGKVVRDHTECPAGMMIFKSVRFNLVSENDDPVVSSGIQSAIVSLMYFSYLLLE